MGVASTLDRTAIQRGALGVVMFAAPGFLLAKVLSAGSDDSLAWLLLVFALFFGTTFGGYVGARERPPTPYTHGALSAGFGLGAVLLLALLVRSITGDLSLGASLSALVILQIGTGLGCLGAWVAEKAGPR